MQPIRPDKGKLVGAGCLLVFGVIFSSISVLILLVSLFVGAPWYFLLFDVPFLVAGFGMLGTGAWGLIVRPMLVGVAFGPPSAAISSYQLRLGERVTVKYEQSARRSLELRRVLIQLVLRESATYRRGTDSHTVVHDTVIDQHEGPGRQLARGDVLAEACTLQVPVDSMHTLELARNKLIWLVRIQVEVPGTPDVTEEIVITVVPDLVEEAQ